MSVSDAQYQDWLQDNAAIRNVLIEIVANIGGTEQTLYLSKLNYTDAGINYLAIASGGINFSEDMGVNGSPSISFGNFEMDNTNGEFDDAYNWVFRNRRALVLVGDVAWPRADYRVILDGIANDLQGGTQNKIIINLLDKLQRLNTPLWEGLLGGTTANKDSLIPVTLGECCNVTPLLTNPATLEYQVHPVAIQDIIEVRDNGIPVTFTKTLSTGKFTLANKPVGSVTASIQGHNVGGYSDDIAGVIKHVVKDNGKSSVAFTDTDIDLTNFSNFATAHIDPIGYYVTNRDNIVTVINALAESISAKVVMSRAGQLRLFQIGSPSGTATRTLTPDDWLAKSFTLESRLPVLSGCKLGYCKNWTTEDLKTAIPPEHKALFKKDYPLTVSSKNNTAASLYIDNATPAQKDTHLISTASAQAEADRLTAFTSARHTLYTFNGLASCMTLELGQLVTIQHNRFGMDSGVLAQVVKLSIDWFNFRVQVWVLV